jgi:hypothetical protein
MNRIHILAAVAIAACVATPAAFAQPKDSQTAGVNAGKASPSVSADQKDAARTERKTVGSQVTTDQMKKPVNSETGQGASGAAKVKVAKTERAAARKERRAEGAAATSAQMKKPVNNETGQPAPTK